MKPIASNSYKHYSFEFFLDTNIPKRELVTCVFCLLTDKSGNLWLTKNKRGWELPGGHIEGDEDYETALKREIMEEIGVESANFKFKGYKKLTNFNESKNGRGGFYPFPHSYIIYFTGEATSERISNFPSGEDETEESGLFDFEQACKLMRSESNEAILHALYD